MPGSGLFPEAVQSGLRRETVGRKQHVTRQAREQPIKATAKLICKGANSIRISGSTPNPQCEEWATSDNMHVVACLLLDHIVDTDTADRIR